MLIVFSPYLPITIINNFFFETCIFGKNFKYCASVVAHISFLTKKLLYLPKRKKN